MPGICDHTSVGMLVWQNDQLLLIERKIPPFGFAPPAGHVDGDDSFETAAKRELQEEVGLDTVSLKLLIEGKKDNVCSRQDGGWHNWKIYQMETSGDINRSEEETKQAGFYDKNSLLALAQKTEQYWRGEIKQTDWETSPGLEPAWYEWLKELKII